MEFTNYQYCCFVNRFAVISFLILVFVLSVPVLCDDEEDHLIQGINSFRQSSNVPPLAKNDNANCVADEIADQLENKECTTNVTQSQIMSDYPNVLKKCNIDVNTTRDGMIIPVCVPHRVATLVLTNYTQSQNSRYLNSSKYTGVGVGTEDDWTVLVLATATAGGSFASGGSQASPCFLGITSLFLMSFMALMY